MNINDRLYMMMDEIRCGPVLLGHYNYEDLVSIIETCTSMMNHSQLNDLLDEHGFTEELFEEYGKQLSPI